MAGEILRAAGLGALQGLTEFLPVSSSGHLALAEIALGRRVEPGFAFVVTVHVATVAAVLVAFRREIGAVLTTERRMIPLLAAGSVPAAVAGILLKDQFKALYGTPLAIAGGFLLTAALLVAGAWVSRRFVERHGEVYGGLGRPLEAVSYLDAIIVGVAQAVAIAPGVSRSGATISAGMMRGVDRRAAVTYSFLLSVPAVLGAAILSAREIGSLASVSMAPLVAGFVAAFVTGLAALKLLVLVVDKGRLHYFAAYCALLAVAAFVICIFEK